MSIERILSGEGLYNIYEYLMSTGKYKVPKWLLKKMQEDDPAMVINEAAGDRGQKLCLKAIDVFILAGDKEAIVFIKIEIYDQDPVGCSRLKMSRFWRWRCCTWEDILLATENLTRRAN